MFGQFFVRHDSGDFVIIIYGVWVSLPGQHKRHLLLGHTVLAVSHEFVDKFHIVELLSYSQSICVFFLLTEDVESSLQCLSEFLSVGSVVRARKQVHAYTFVVVLVTEGVKLVELLNFHHQVYGFTLLVMIDELRNDLLS